METELDSPRMPLEPTVPENDPRNEDIWEEYNHLLSEYQRIDEIKNHKVKGATLFGDDKEAVYTVDEYNRMLKKYRAERKAYNAKYAGQIETIEMVREKMRKIDEESEAFDQQHPEDEEKIIEPPELEDSEEGNWEDFKEKLGKWSEGMSKSCKSITSSWELTAKRSDFMLRKLAEMSKFPQLDYELEMRLRYTYIDPQTGEQYYRPDDEVGEGLICFGSRDHKPVLKDE